MSPGANSLCDLIVRLEQSHPLNPEDMEVLMTLLHGLLYSGDMRALLHGIAAGILAQFARQDRPGEEQL